MPCAQVAALERAQQDPERRRAAEELAARRDALEAERRALEAEEEGLRAAVAAAAGGRGDAEARKAAAAEELARARAETETAREKDSQVGSLPDFPAPDALISIRPPYVRTRRRAPADAHWGREGPRAGGAAGVRAEAREAAAPGGGAAPPGRVRRPGGRGERRPAGGFPEGF